MGFFDWIKGLISSKPKKDYSTWLDEIKKWESENEEFDEKGPKITSEDYLNVFAGLGKNFCDYDGGKVKTTKRCKLCRQKFCSTHSKPLKHYCNHIKTRRQGTMPDHCNTCGVGIGGVHRLKCVYCNKLSCEKHRLPKNHFCTGKPTPLPGGFANYTADGMVSSNPSDKSYL